MSAPAPYRLVIADDHPLFRGALREAVTGLFPRESIAEAGSFDDISKLLDRTDDIDLVLLDLTMPGVRGFSGLMYMRAQYPGVPVVVADPDYDLGPSEAAVGVEERRVVAHGEAHAPARARRPEARARADLDQAALYGLRLRYRGFQPGADG